MQRMVYRMFSSRQLLLARGRIAGKGPRVLASGASHLFRPQPQPRGRNVRSTIPQRLITVNAAALEVEPLDTGAAGFATSALQPMSWPGRSHCVAELAQGHEGNEVVVCGWVDRNRYLGGLGFLDVRDHTGLLQVRRSTVRGAGTCAAHAVASLYYDTQCCATSGRFRATDAA